MLRQQTCACCAQQINRYPLLLYALGFQICREAAAFKDVLNNDG